MTSLLRRAAARRQTATDDAPTGPSAGRRSRALRIGVLATTLALVAGGTAAGVASAHKSVTLDVDGEVREVTTFAGSIGGLLEEHDVEVGERDVVAPAADAALGDGSEVVVRHARALTVLTDGQESTVWTTALTADEALATLEARGADVHLQPSRSGGRAALGLPLADGPVDVQVDGTTHAVADGSVGVGEVLSDLGVTLGEFDRVQVRPAGPDAGAAVTVVVQRVVVHEEGNTSAVPFETVTEASADLYEGQSRTVTEGVVGELTTMHRVVLVDGVEESRRLLSETVTRAPVAQVVHEGTKQRPVAPRAAASPRSSSGGGGGGGAVVTGDVWGALAQCESGGNPSIVSRNGLYYGLYQFSPATWRSVGGSGLPSEASVQEQTQRAQALQARSGWGQWPACAAKLGLL